jgi:NADH dehydrogenase
MKTLFIAGATGFVGRELLAQLDPGVVSRAVCLSRTGGEGARRVAPRVPVEWVRGDLAEAPSYERHLRGVDAAINLAAITGKARREGYFRANAHAVSTLVRVCKAARVERLLHVSTVAVKFPDKTRYEYAQSKEEGERIARESGLRVSIVRPAIILGPESPAWKGLGTLAFLPIIPMFGDGRTPIQPIHVSDVAAFLRLIVERDLFNGATLEFGGPQVITIQQFLQKAHTLRSGKPAPVLPIPMSLLVGTLSLLEPLFHSVLPLTVGQLSSFRYSGVMLSNELREERLAQMKSLDEMLGPLCARDAK